MPILRQVNDFSLSLSLSFSPFSMLLWPMIARARKSRELCRWSLSVLGTT